MSELTRRELGLTALVSLVIKGAVINGAVVNKSAAQSTPDWFAQAVESKRKAALELAAYEIGMSVEPAFQFKP